MTSTAAAPDRTALDFKLDPTVDRAAGTLPFANPNWLANPASMLIPAGVADQMYSFQIDPSLFLGFSTFDIFAAGLHAPARHARQLDWFRPQAANQCLLEINDWNFHWQGGYSLRTPVRFAPATGCGSSAAGQLSRAPADGERRAPAAARCDLGRAPATDVPRRVPVAAP
jgi:hypothetical protein